MFTRHTGDGTKFKKQIDFHSFDQAEESSILIAKLTKQESRNQKCHPMFFLPNYQNIHKIHIFLQVIRRNQLKLNLLPL